MKKENTNKKIKAHPRTFLKGRATSAQTTPDDEPAHPRPFPKGRATPTQPTPDQDSSFEAIDSLVEDPEGKYGYQWADPFYYKAIKNYALQNRNCPTKAEEILWQSIKSKKLGNYKFRRQHIVDRYIADIVCLDKNLIIEIDGLIHQLPENVASDEERTIALEKKGFNVIRFTNDDVIHHLESTLKTILEKLNGLPGFKEISDLSSPLGGQGAAIWNILSEVKDPEVPVLSIIDLGIVRDVEIVGEKINITITPTYSGCPAMDVISMDIRLKLIEKGFRNISIQQQLSPAWTTDWMTNEGKEKLKAFGIAPPNPKQQFCKEEMFAQEAVACPRCDSYHTELISQFGSTACKAMYRCLDCKEAFDYFKCH